MMEHRLIHYNLADMSDQTKYNSRTAEANDAQQIAQRQAQLAAGGKDVAPVAKVATNQDLAAAKTVYQAASQGNQSSLQNGQTFNVGSGEIQRGAAQRLIDSGMNPGQVNAQMEKSKGQASQTMTNTGLGAQYDQKGNVIAGSGRLPHQSKADQVEAQLRGQGIADPITIANAKAAALTEETAQMQKDQASKEISDKNAAANATSNAAAGAAASESGTATTPAPTTPQDAGLSAAIAGLPPEYAFLGPVLQAQQAEFAKAQADQQALYDKSTGTTDAAYDAIDKRIDGVESSYKAGTEAIQGLLSQVKEQQSKNIDDQEKAAKDRLAWSELQQSREIERNKVKTVDSKVASLALRGGFGSGAGLSEIEETTRSYENALDDLRSEYGVQRTELGAKFTALHNQVFSDYATNSINNIKDMLSSVERIGQQKNASTEARAKAENDALTTLITNQTNLRREASKDLVNGALIMKTVIGEGKTAKAQKEKDALDQIKYLSENYAPEDVADSIRTLAKDITSFDASQLAGQPSIKVALALKKLGQGSGGGGGGFGGMAGAPTQPQAPIMTMKEFMDQKISEKEAQLGMSMSPTARQEYIAANSANFSLEYQHATSTPAETVQTSGNADVDKAAQLVYSGVLPSVSEAAKKLGLPYGQIAEQVGRLQSSSVSGGFIPMNDTQQKAFLNLSKSMNTDPVVQYARAVPGKVQNILNSLDNRDGVSDLAAINSLQSGLIDPGVSVKSEDVTLLVNKASALTSKFGTDYWKTKFNKGGIIPESERQQIRDLANEMQKTIVDVYQSTAFPRFKQQGQALGIPEKNLDILKQIDYSVPDFTRTTDIETSSGDSELDSLLSSYGIQ